jgi:hypothetical protein
LAGVFSSDIQAQITYAYKHGFTPQLKHLLKTHERFDELAQLHSDEKSFPASVEYFLAAFNQHGDIKSLERAATVVIGCARAIVLLEGRYREVPRRQLLQIMSQVFPYSEKLSRERQKEVSG